jgi:hypothetical protein
MAVSRRNTCSAIRARVDRAAPAIDIRLSMAELPVRYATILFIAPIQFSEGSLRKLIGVFLLTRNLSWENS